METKEKILSLLSRHNSYDHSEEKSILSFQAFVQNHTNLYGRDNLSGQITTSTWIIDLDCSYVLLLFHKKLEKWLQPGGHVEKEDLSLLDAALREAYEETGFESFDLVDENIFDVDVHPIPERKNIPSHYHYDIRFCIKTKRTKDKFVNQEQTTCLWVPISLIIDNQNYEPTLRRMARKTLELKHQ